MKVTATTITEDQMLQLRGSEHRARPDTRYEVIYAIDRVLGCATIPAFPGDLYLIADAWNARHGYEP